MAWSFPETEHEHTSLVIAVLCGFTLALLIFVTSSYSRPRYSSQREFEGLNQVWPAPNLDEPKGPTIDIVAIHGLDTGSPKTWVAYRNRRDPSDGLVHWLKDDNMLPAKFSNARIFTYDWHANTVGDSVDDDLFGHAKTLLRSLGSRSLNGTPILFIASCFGGLLLAKTISQASSHARDEYDLIKNTRGIIFLGTPFRGSDTAKAAEIRVQLARTMGGESSANLIRYIKNPRFNLQETVESFAVIAKSHQIPLICFYETKPSLVLSGLLPSQFVSLIPEWLKVWIPYAKERVLVPSDSASLDTFSPLALHVKHALLNKFFGPDDVNFNKLCVELKKLKDVGTNGLRRALDDFYRRTGRLDIDRLSSQKLDMNCCFINLGMVNYVHDSSKRVKDESLNRDSDKFYHQRKFTLRARLLVDTPPPESQITLQELFRPRPDSAISRPHCIWIWGCAGVGKTTLCKKIVFEFTNKRLWEDLYDCIFWLPLRRLKLMRDDPKNLGEFIQRQYFSDHYDFEFSAEYIQKTLKLHGDRLLFILDGLDEVNYILDAQSSISNILDDLLNQPNVIITSRPHTMRRLARTIDLEMETIGFFPEQVEEYLQRQQIPEKTLSDIREYIASNPLVQSLARIPVQLDAICYAWSPKLFHRDRITMSSLYWAILGRLCEKDIPKLGKKSLNGEKITQQQLQGYSTVDLLPIVSHEFNLLGRLAFDGLREGVTEFDMDWISRINSDNLSMPNDALLHMSFLRSSDTSIDPQDRTYHFLHLTYQEFLAAKYFVDQWKASANHTSASETETKDFVRMEKYNPRYIVFWRFVVGLLRITAPSLLDGFFELLCGEPLDILGVIHQRFVIHCLGEIYECQNVSSAFHFRVEEMEKEFLEWTRTEDEIFGHATKTLLSATDCSDAILQFRLQNSDDEQKLYVLRALKDRPSVSFEILNSVTELLNVSTMDEEIHKFVFSVLGQHYPENAKEKLSKIIQTKNMQRIAADGFCYCQALVLPALDILLQMLQTGDADVREASIEALTVDRFVTLPTKTTECLIHTLQHGNSDVQEAAASALRGSAHNRLRLEYDDLPASVAELIIPLFQHPKPLLRRTAADILFRRANVSDAVYECVVQLIQDEDGDVQRAAADAFYQKKKIPASTLEFLVPLLKSKNSWVRFRVANALIDQERLLEPVVDSLVALLQDENFETQVTAAYVLCTQNSTSESALRHTVRLFQDNFSLLNATEKMTDTSWHSISALAAELLTPLLQCKEIKQQITVLRMLKRYHHLPVTRIEYIIHFLEHKNQDIRHAAANVIRSQMDLQAQSIEQLTQLLQGESWDPDIEVAEALCERKTLPDDTVEALIDMIEDMSALTLDEALKIKIPVVRTELSRSAFDRLIQLLEDEHFAVRRHAIMALNGQTKIPTRAVENLTELIKQNSLRYNSIDLLSCQEQLPTSAIEVLVSVLAGGEGEDIDNDDELYRCTLSALTYQPRVSEEALGKIISCLQCKKDDASDFFCSTLVGREEFYTLIPKLNATDRRVAVKMALGSNFHESTYSFIWKDHLYIHTYESPKPKILKLENAEEFRRAWISARDAAGYPGLA